MIRRLLLSALLSLPWLAHADWAADRDGSLVYAPVTVLASAVDEAVPFFIVYGSDLDAAFHAAMDTAGDTTGATIRASNADGTTQIACWPVGVSTSTDTFALFVRGDTMSASTDTDFRIYAGNSALSLPAVTDTYGRNAVFSGYAGVYLPGMSTDDFTGSGRNLTAVNTPSTTASPYEGITAATYAAASSEYHHYNGTQGLTNWPITLETAAVTSVGNAYQYLFGVGDDSSVTSFSYISLDYNTTFSKGETIMRGQTGAQTRAVGSTSVSLNNWAYYATTRNAATGTTYIYTNGGSSVSDSTTITDLGATDLDRLRIGVYPANTLTGYLTGSVAYALLSGSARSANYVSTMQDVWSGALYSAGASVDLGSGCVSGSTGGRLFTSAVNGTATVDVDWASLGNVLVEDANATVAANVPDGEYTELLWLDGLDYGTTVPSGADSYSVTVQVNRGRQSGSGREAYDDVVRLIVGGSLAGNDLSNEVLEWGAGATTVEYTGDWGIVFDGADFDGDFGVAIRALSGGNTTASINVYWVKVVVAWDCGDVSGSAGFYYLLR